MGVGRTRWLVAAAAVAMAALRAEPATMGWRGDGTGKFPAANPPVVWGRVSKAVRGLRFQATRPREGDAGRPMPDGVAREWLVLGPVPLVDPAAFDKEPPPAESDSPGGLGWKRVAIDNGCLDFATLWGQRPKAALGEPLGGAGLPKAAAYAATHLCSEAGGAFRLNLTHVGKVRLWLNGKPLPDFAARVGLRLEPGWNRLVIKAAPGEEDWYLVPILTACPPAEYEETNIAWKTALPGAAPGFYGGAMGVGSPVVVGDRLFLQSESYDLVCLDKRDGRLLWMRTNSFFDSLSDAERAGAFREVAPLAAKLDGLNAAVVAGKATPNLLGEKLAAEREIHKGLRRIAPERFRRYEPPDVGFSGYTPVTDGRRVWAWFGMGVTACYDLEGNRRWIRADVLPAVEHGFSSSPLLVEGKVVVFMRDLMAFEAETGKLAWQTKLMPHEGPNPQGFFHGTPFATAIGGVGIIVLGNGSVVRASDGAVLYRNPEMGTQAIASPVVEGRDLLVTSSHSMQLFIQRLPEALVEPLKLATRTVSVRSSFPKYYMPWHLSSPVVHDGLAYLVNNTGVLTVVDVAAGEVVYQRLLDLDAFQWSNEGAARGVGASPILAGGRLYVLGNAGGALVLEPGRAYRQAAKNKLESVVQAGHWSERQERFVASPVPDGSRLYIRGEATLYAIEAR